MCIPGFISGTIYTANWVMFLRYLGDLCYWKQKNPFICTSHSKKVNHFTSLGGQDKISDENGGGLQKHIWQGFLSFWCGWKYGKPTGKTNILYLGISWNFQITPGFLRNILIPQTFGMIFQVSAVGFRGVGVVPANRNSHWVVTKRPTLKQLPG